MRGLVLTLAASLALASSASAHPIGVINGCASQSSAGFPHAFTDARNLVVGPLVMIGAGQLTTAETVRRFGGNKFPLLVAAGHRVTIETARHRLAYGRHSRQAHRVATFHSCKGTRALSRADGGRVTFWSGFVLASAPACVALKVWVDDEPAPRGARIPLGRRCQL